MKIFFVCTASFPTKNTKRLATDLGFNDILLYVYIFLITFWVHNSITIMANVIINDYTVSFFSFLFSFEGPTVTEFPRIQRTPMNSIFHGRNSIIGLMFLRSKRNGEFPEIWGILLVNPFINLDCRFVIKAL